MSGLDTMYRILGETVKTCATEIIDFRFRNGTLVESLSNTFCLPGNIPAAAFERQNICEILMIDEIPEILGTSTISNVTQQFLYGAMESAGNVLTPNTALIFSTIGLAAVGAAYLLSSDGPSEENVSTIKFKNK